MPACGPKYRVNENGELITVFLGVQSYSASDHPALPNMVEGLRMESLERAVGGTKVSKQWGVGVDRHPGDGLNQLNGSGA